MIKEIKGEQKPPCKTCKREFRVREISQYVCDHCKKELGEFPPRENKREIFYLDATLHQSCSGKYTNYHLCSWKCFAAFIKEMGVQEEDWFISMPYISFEKTDIGQRYEDFLEILK